MRDRILEWLDATYGGDNSAEVDELLALIRIDAGGSPATSKATTLPNEFDATTDPCTARRWEES